MDCEVIFCLRMLAFKLEDMIYMCMWGFIIHLLFFSFCLTINFLWSLIFKRFLYSLHMQKYQSYMTFNIKIVMM